MEVDYLTSLPRRIHLIVDEGAKAGASRPALTDERGIVWSYRRLIDTIEAVAGDLARLGIRPGDRVMVVGENSIGAIVLMYAASRLDAWAVMTNARLGPHELDAIESDCKPRRVFYTHGISAEADAAACRRGAEAEAFTGIEAIKVGKLEASAVPEEVYEDPARQVAVLIYTTGTTGRPKGVMLSHRNLAYVAGRGKRTNTLFPEDVTLCVMPISHSYGLTLLQGMLFVGAHLRIMDKAAIEICEAFAKAGYPLDVEALLIVEVEGSDAEMDATLADITAIARANGATTVRESRSAIETAAIWKGRKSAFGATGRVADYLCMDGTVPTGKLSYVLAEISKIVQRHGLRVANVFHAGDGNMHPLILYNANDPSQQSKAEAAGDDILRLCVEVGGCLTGEHGVGIEKRDLMRYQFDDADLVQQIRVRAAFDPRWLLNTDKVFPLDFRCQG